MILLNQNHHHPCFLLPQSAFLLTIKPNIPLCRRYLGL
uniref:Uncharacterized protein n=1 Tax=Rhizophora mucronata TaxID=61149 RepID=A0A2P2NM12_RHIMU